MKQDIRKVFLLASTEELIREYTRAIIEGNAALFAGAGLSRSSGYVDWKNLVKPLANEIRLDVNKETDLVAVTQYYKNERMGRGSINSKIVAEFTRNCEPNENIRILTRLPITTYWTTNYDELIETALRENNRKVDVKIDQKQLAFTLPDRDAVLYKMHGDVSHPDDAVLTKDDYETYGIKHSLFRTALQGDLVSKTFLFVGFSFEDPNLDYVLSQIHSLLGETQREHYCFFEMINKRAGENDEEFAYRKVKQEYRIKDLQRYGIQAVMLDSYNRITEILQKIEFAHLLKNIFISGSALIYRSPWSKDTAESFAFSLSQRLVNEEYKIISGFGLGIGSAVINGALEEVYHSKYKHVDEHLCLRPFPQGITDTEARKKLYKAYREEMISQAGIAIFMFGNKKSDTGQVIEADGMLEEYKIAKAQRKIIIPIGNTGDAAHTIWEEIKSNIGDYPYLADNIDKLGSVVNSDELVNLILEIIVKQQIV